MDSWTEKGVGKTFFSRGGRIGKTEGFPGRHGRTSWAVGTKEKLAGLICYTTAMEMKTSSLIILAIVLSIIASVLLQISDVGKRHFMQVTSYDECVAAGNPVMESYPTQCRTPDGRIFVNPRDLIDTAVAEPTAN